MAVDLDYRIGAGSNKRRVGFANGHGQGDRKTVTCCLWTCMQLLDVDDGPKRQSSGTREQGCRSTAIAIQGLVTFDTTTQTPSEHVFLIAETLSAASTRLLAAPRCIPSHIATMVHASTILTHVLLRPWQVHVRCTVK
jgi:hypothetical protein